VIGVHRNTIRCLAPLVTSASPGYPSGHRCWCAPPPGSFSIQNEGVVHRAVQALGLIDSPLPLIFNRLGVVIAMTSELAAQRGEPSLLKPARQTLTWQDQLGVRSCGGAKDRNAHVAAALAVAAHPPPSRFAMAR
jgi:hypothetical protein